MVASTVAVTAAPSAPSPAPAARSSAPGALGVLSIVFGALVALSELVDLVRVALMQDRATTDLLGGVGVEMQAAARYTAVRALAMFVLSLVLVVVGVGLKLRIARARVAAIVWSALALAALVGRVVLWETCIWPHFDRARQITGGAINGTGIPILGDMTSELLELAHYVEYVALVALLPYPIVLAAILTRRRVRESL